MQQARTVRSGRRLATELRGASKSLHDRQKFSLGRYLSLVFLYDGIVTGQRTRFKQGLGGSFVQRDVPGKANPLGICSTGINASAARRSPDNYTPSETRRLAHLPRNKTSGPAWPE